MATKSNLLARNASGIDDVFTESDSEIQVAADSSADLTGDRDTVTLGSGATLSVHGVGHVINGSGATISALANAQMNVNGDGDVVDLGAGANVTLHGLGHKVSGSGASIVGSANSQLDVTGDGDSVGLEANADCSITGSDNHVAASDDRVSLSGSTVANVLSGTHNNVFVDISAHASVQGDKNRVVVGAGATVAVSGVANRMIGADFALTASDGASVFVGGTGATGHDHVTTAHSTVIVGANSNVDVSGSDDFVAIRPLANATLDGDGLTAHVGKGASVTVHSQSATGGVDVLTGAGFNVSVGASSHVLLASRNTTATVGADATLEVRRSGNTIDAGDSDTISLVGGSANDVVLGSNDHVIDNSFGSLFEIHGGVGATRIEGVGADSQFIVELFNGVGGFATAGDAFAALKDDGAGGLSLALGSSGTIDFAGAAAGSIGAGNFKIG